MVNAEKILRCRKSFTALDLKEAISEYTLLSVFVNLLSTKMSDCSVSADCPLKVRSGQCKITTAALDRLAVALFGAGGGHE